MLNLALRSIPTDPLPAHPFAIQFGVGRLLQNSGAYLSALARRHCRRRTRVLPCYDPELSIIPLPKACECSFGPSCPNCSAGVGSGPEDLCRMPKFRVLPASEWWKSDIARTTPGICAHSPISPTCPEWISWPSTHLRFAGSPQGSTVGTRALPIAGLSQVRPNAIRSPKPQARADNSLRGNQVHSQPADPVFRRGFRRSILLEDRAGLPRSWAPQTP